MKNKILLLLAALSLPVPASASDMSSLGFVFTAVIPFLVTTVLTLVLLGITLGAAWKTEKGGWAKAASVLIYLIWVVCGLGILTTMLMMPEQLGGRYRGFALSMFIPVGFMAYSSLCAWLARRALRAPSEGSVGAVKIAFAFYFTLGLLTLLGGYLWNNFPY